LVIKNTSKSFAENIGGTILSSMCKTVSRANNAQRIFRKMKQKFMHVVLNFKTYYLISPDVYHHSKCEYLVD